jgi:cell wall-associated NlpC family hydrolase
MPYVWGGTTDNTADGLEHGGYDCSGFAWRVYKLSGLPWGRQIRGRTAAEQGGEIPSDEWAINSSAQGVYVLPLTSGWLAESFTWARRVL